MHRYFGNMRQPMFENCPVVVGNKRTKKHNAEIDKGK